MKKTSLRVICVLLICTMLPIGMLACANDADSATDTTAAPANAETTVPEETADPNYDANGYWKDDLPEDLTFGTTDTPAPINFLYWEDVEHEEFVAEDLNGETVNDAIYNRNRKVEERLGIKFGYLTCNGDSGETNTFVNFVNKAITAGTQEFDMIGVYSLTGASLAAKGYLYNLYDLPYLNFDQPWWPDRLITQATVNNKLYFASGDISGNALYMMYTCFFNKEMLNDYKLENPQELVQKNEWTYEKFFELCEGVYSDLNGNQEKDEPDQFGYMSSGIHVDPWFYGCGALFVEKNAEGQLQMSSSFSSEKVVNIVQFVNSKFWDTNDSIHTPSVKHQNAFAEKRLLFCIDRARVSFRNFALTDVQYGIVPCPKYEASQESFITVMANPFSLYCLPIDCKDPDMLSAVMECFASESYRTLTPAIFEITLKIKYSDDAVSAEMYDLIRENLTFDIGRIYSKSLMGQSDFRNALENNSNTWASVGKVREKEMNRKLQTLQKIFED